MFAILNSRGESIYLLNGGDIISYKKHPNFPEHSTLFVAEFLCGFYTTKRCLITFNDLMEAIITGKKGFKMPPDSE